MLASRQWPVPSRPTLLAAVLSVFFSTSGPWITRSCAELLVSQERAEVAAQFDWNNGDISDSKLGGFGFYIGVPESPFSAYEQARGPALIRAAAYQNRDGVNAVSADSGIALEELPFLTAMGTAKYEFKVRERELQMGAIDFDFVINGGELRISNFDQFVESTDNVRVHARLNIRTESISGAWDLDVSILRVGDFVAMSDNSTDGLGVGFPPLIAEREGNDAVLRIPRFHGIVSLDRADFYFNFVRNPETAKKRVPLFQYLMSAEVNFGNQPTGAVGGLAQIGDPFSLSGGGPSTDGVEFFLDGMRLGSFARVPEPSTAVLLALALACASLRRFGTRDATSSFR